MNCRQCQELILKIAFGEAERTEDFGRHLDVCPTCRREYAVAAFAAGGIEDAPQAPAPSLSNERLHQAILSANLQSRSSWRPRLALAGGLAAAVAAVWLGMALPQGESVVDEPIARADELREPSVIERFSPVPPPAAATAEPEVVASATPADRPKRRANMRRPVRRERPEEIVEAFSPVPPDLLAAADVTTRPGSFNAEPAAARGAPNPEASKPSIIVIQPEGQATEVEPNDIPIGG